MKNFMTNKAAVLMLMSATVLSAQSPSAKAPMPAAPGATWESLFDGKTLDGWVKVGEEKWEVDDGSIHGKGVTQAYGYLRSAKQYVDFHLALRFKCEADGNSGVFFHWDRNPGTGKSQGLQFEITPIPGRKTGGIYGDGRGWIVWPSPENQLVIRPYEWNELLLKVEGNHYVGRLNGVVVVDFTDPTPKSFDGYIAFQLHSGGLGEMRFKDIFVRDLSRR